MPMLMKRPNSCSGPSCPGCSSANCMADGGKVKGVHESDDETKGKSMAGIFARHSKDEGEVGESSKRLAKGEHEKVLGELRSMPKPKLYSKGGEIKGVNKPSLSDPGTSEAGKKLKPAFSVGGSKWDTEAAKDTHRKTLGEMKDMKSQDRTNLSRGGEIKGVHPESRNKGESKAGRQYRNESDYDLKDYPRQDEDKKETNPRILGQHRGVLGQMQSMKSQDRTNLAHGGEIKGVHTSVLDKRGNSKASDRLSEAHHYGKDNHYDEMEKVKDEHQGVLDEIRSMKKGDRTNLAEGGEVSDHDELHEALGHELMDAFDKKDKKGVMDVLHAVVLNRMNRDD